MKKKKVYDENMPQGKLIRIPDFLPPPEELFLGGDKIKVTLYLKRASVKFFKEKAEKCHYRYQTMMREVVDRYVQRYSQEE